MLSPASAPGVPDDVVLNAVLLTPTDSNDSVVDISGASLCGSDDARRITLEDVVACSDGDVEGLFCELGQVGTRALCLSVGRNGSDAFSGIILAGSVLGSVRVVRLLHGLVGLEPVVGPEVPTTVAAFVTSGAGAVNELLLRHDSEGVALNCPSGLDSRDGRESPARTAISLELHGGAFALGTPVVGSGDV